MLANNQILSICCLIFSLIMKIQASTANQVDQLWFSNVGYNGYYNIVENVGGDDKCECSIMTDRHYFEGANAPLNEPLSVHFRGPLSLNKFAFYTSDAFYANSNSSQKSSSWKRAAFYDHNNLNSTSNVTFMNTEGEKSKCLGNALSYADLTGLHEAKHPTILSQNNYIGSDKEFSIFSNVSCPESSVYGSCGVYRKGIPAHEGFYGDVKMFLFEFETPTETQKNSSHFESFDMPAIWLLNSQIPRQSQYPRNNNCSCWASGCGEFDIFEAVKGSSTSEFFSTFHTYQGADSVGKGLSQGAYFNRKTSGAMIGGVVFDSDGNTISFMTDALSFDQTISPSTLLKALKVNQTSEAMTTLATISTTYTATSITGFTTSYKNEVANLINSKLSAIASFFIVLFNIL